MGRCPLKIMSVFNTFIVFGVFFVTITNVTAQTPTGEELNDICTCDLYAIRCDINCCCDPDCNESDRKAFSQCDDYFGKTNHQMCVQKKMIFINNSPFMVNESSDSLFCIYSDNYLSRNSYFVPEPANDTMIFDRHLGVYQITVKPIFNTTKYPYNFNVSENAIYKSGVPIYTQFQSNTIGMLGLPRALNNAYCLDENPAGFLVDASNTCVRQIQPLATSCQTDPALNALTYFEKFKILPKPDFLSPITRDPINGLYPDINGTLLTKIEPLLPATCIDIDSFSLDCTLATSVPTPQYNAATQTCDFAVSEVFYNISYTNNKGIVGAGVTFTLKSIKDKDLPLRQTYKIKFAPSDWDDTKPKRSGNPGYYTDAPVLAGKKVEATVDAVTKVAVELSSDPDNWLTMLTSTLSGDCVANKNSRTPIKFGINMRSGCTVSVSLQNLTDSCQLLQDTSKNLLLGQNPPEYVGRFGNTDPAVFGDWVPILTENEPPAAQGSTSQSGVCFNMVLGLHYQILYARTGMLYNPQNKIIGVMRRFSQPQELRFNCMGEYCRPDTVGLQQKIEIISSVSFLDVSQPAVHAEKERPLLAVRLPFDFFYPFLSSPASKLSTGVVTSWFSATLVTVLVIGLK